MQKRDELISALSEVGDITGRSMFGGHGVYWRRVIFAIVYRERIYFKVDGESKGDFLNRGMEPFRPNDRMILKSYYEVPHEVLKESESLLSWAREAMRASQTLRKR
jgi:DNA transformation protein